MAEELFQGGVCGGTWWNPSLFSGSGGGANFTSPCSVAQLGGGYDMGNFGWPNQVMKSMPNNQVDDNNSLVSSINFDSTLDIMGLAPSPTTDWNQQNQFCKIGINGENFDSIFQDNPSTRLLNYEPGQSTSTIINNSSNFPNQDGSPPTTMTTSSNNSGDSSTITIEAGLNTGFPMSSTTSYLIQTLFEDFDDLSQLTGNTTNNDYGRELMSSPCLWPKSSSPLTPPSPLDLVQSDQLFNEGMNMAVTNDDIVLSNIRASLLNSLQSRSKASSLNQKPHKFSSSQATMLNHEEVVQESKKKMNNNEQQAAKRPRIETPSSLPTFKVRKEKLGDRITALQQLVSPFGKTDTASVLHEAIEYIKFLHDQVHVLTTPYLKDGAGVQHQQASVNICNHDKTKQDLRSRGLCVVPISSTYPVTQETPVDFWTPTFGGTTFR